MFLSGFKILRCPSSDACSGRNDSHIVRQCQCKNTVFSNPQIFCASCLQWRYGDRFDILLWLVIFLDRCLNYGKKLAGNLLLSNANSLLCRCPEAVVYCNFTLWQFYHMYKFLSNFSHWQRCISHCWQCKNSKASFVNEQNIRRCAKCYLYVQESQWIFGSEGYR